MRIVLFFIFSTASINDVSSTYGVEHARKGQFEFAASIYSKGLHKCNGAIISFLHIITTAHCIYNESIRDLRVTVGPVSISRATKWREVQNTHIFSGYHPGTNDNDIGIIQLQQSLSSSNRINVIPYKETGQNCALDLECTLVWFKSKETASIHKINQALFWRHVKISIVNGRRELYVQFENKSSLFQSKRPEDSGAPIICNRILAAILGNPMTDTEDKMATVVMIGPYERWIEKKIS